MSRLFRSQRNDTRDGRNKDNKNNGFHLLFRKIAPVVKFNIRINTCTIKTTTEKGNNLSKRTTLGQRISLTGNSFISKITDNKNDFFEHSDNNNDDDDITCGPEYMYTPSPKTRRVVTTMKDVASLPDAPRLLFPMTASLSSSSLSSTPTSLSSKISCRLSPRPEEFGKSSSSNPLTRLLPPVSFVFVPQNFKYSDAFRRQSNTCNTVLQHKRKGSYLQRPPPRMIGLCDWDDHSIESVYSHKDEEANNESEKQNNNLEDSAEAVIAAMKPWINRRNVNAARLTLLQNVSNNNNNNNKELPNKNHDVKFESARLIEKQQEVQKQKQQQQQQQQQHEQYEPKRVVKWHIVRSNIS
jgi:hypothetical protein